MKNTFNMFGTAKKNALLAGLMFCLAGIGTAQASTVVTFSVDMTTNYLNGTFNPATDSVYVDGSFNGWQGLSGAVQLQEEGLSAPYIYTNTVTDTADTNGVMLYKFMCNNSAFSGQNGYESLCDGGGNRGLYLNGGTMAPPTPFFSDSGAGLFYTNTLTFQVDMSQQIALGSFHPGTDTIGVIGNFNGWSASTPMTNDPAIVITNEPSGILTSNVYTGTYTNSTAVSSNAHMAYQFIINGVGSSGGYEGIPGGYPNNDGGGNRFFTMLPTDQTFPIAFFHDAPFAPIASNITFSVDMTIVQLTDTNYNPASVTLDGDFTGWGDVGCTNDPTAANTNIYTATNSYTIGIGAIMTYQYRYTHLDDSSFIVYDHASGGGNRIYSALDTNPYGTNILSVWDDASLNDYIVTPTPVYFSVDMSSATTNDLYVYGTNNVGPFHVGSDNVYINGQFANWYAWSGGANPATAPAGYQMIQSNSSSIYTNTIIIPAGTPVAFEYKYGTDPGGYNGGPYDDENVVGTNHFRVVRSTAFNPYPMPLDTFGDAYHEPFFNVNSHGGGDLAVGASTGGMVPVTWLGRPGAHLQVTTDLTSGAWQDLPATDGTNWSAGYFSTNGFVSQTNYPSGGGAAYFRLAKP